MIMVQFGIEAAYSMGVYLALFIAAASTPASNSASKISGFLYVSTAKCKRLLPLLSLYSTRSLLFFSMFLTCLVLPRTIAMSKPDVYNIVCSCMNYSPNKKVVVLKVCLVYAMKINEILNQWANLFFNFIQ